MSTYVFVKALFLGYYIYEVITMYSPMLDPVLVGEVIAEVRRERKLSQEVLSGLAGIGRTHLSAIERGERKPTLETLYRIAAAMDIKMSDIILRLEKRL